MLTGQHRHRFNRLGAARWDGFVYGGPAVLPRLLRPVVYHGPMGIAPFQTVQRDRSATVLMWATATLPLVVAAGLLAVPLAVVSPVALVVPGAVLLLLAIHASCVAAATRVAPGEPSPWRLRWLVGLLHVLQPLARVWGRLRGTPLPAREVVDPPWRGSREAWLRALRRDLASHWCVVRAGPPHGSWDLAVAVGPVLRCRLHTAVRWEWDPVSRRTWALSPTGVAAVVLAAFALALAPEVGVALAGALLASSVVEAVVLARLTGGAVARTTRTVAVGS